MKIHFNSPPSKPEESLGLSVRYAPAKRALSKWRWRFIVLLLIWPLLFYLGKYLYSTIWANMPGYVEMEETVLKTPVPGKISHALNVGSSVTKVEIIAQLENGELNAEYSDLIAKKTESRERKAGGTEALVVASKLRDYRKERYLTMVKLGSRGAATEADVADSFAALQAAEKDVLNARADIDARHVEKNAENTAEPRLAELQWKIESLKIKAPWSGVVAQVYAKPGEWIPGGGDVASIRSENPPFIQAYVEPAMAKYATVGHLATIRFLDGGSVRARVTSVGLATHRMPSDAYNPLLSKGESIVVVLETASLLPSKYRIRGLPVNIHFDLF